MGQQQNLHSVQSTHWPDNTLLLAAAHQWAWKKAKICSDSLWSVDACGRVLRCKERGHSFVIGAGRWCRPDWLPDQTLLDSQLGMGTTNCFSRKQDKTHQREETLENDILSTCWMFLAVSGALHNCRTRWCRPDQTLQGSQAGMGTPDGFYSKQENRNKQNKTKRRQNTFPLLNICTSTILI